MNKVVMTHPNLPGQEVEVQEAALPHHERAGWRRLVEPSEAPAEDEPTETEE